VLVLGHGHRPATYSFDGIALSRRAFTFLSATSPAWGRVVQELAQRAWDDGVSLRELLAADERARGLDLDAIFDYSHYIRHADEIIARLDDIA
jgi:hypothetical protein